MVCRRHQFMFLSPFISIFVFLLFMNLFMNNKYLCGIYLNSYSITPLLDRNAPYTFHTIPMCTRRHFLCVSLNISVMIHLIRMTAERWKERERSVCVCINPMRKQLCIALAISAASQHICIQILIYENVTITVILHVVLKWHTIHKINGLFCEAEIVFCAFSFLFFFCSLTLPLLLLFEITIIFDWN